MWRGHVALRSTCGVKLNLSPGCGYEPLTPTRTGSFHFLFKVSFSLAHTAVVVGRKYKSSFSLELLVLYVICETTAVATLQRVLNQFFSDKIVGRTPRSNGDSRSFRQFVLKLAVRPIFTLLFIFSTEDNLSFLNFMVKPSSDSHLGVT